MSWKLAELRWRHDIGLFESRWDRESGALPVERKKAVEVFENRQRRSRSLSAAKAAARSNLVDENSVGLGDPLLGALPATRSPVKSPQPALSSRSSRGRGFSCSSLVPLLQAVPGSHANDLVDDPVLQDLSNSRQPVTRYHSCAAFSSDASDHHSPPTDHTQCLQSRSCVLSWSFEDGPNRVDSQNSEELEQLLNYQDSGVSSPDLTERLIWPTPSELPQTVRLPDGESPLQVQRDTLDPSFVEAFDNLLEFEGAIFELLNNDVPHSFQDIQPSHDSSNTRWPSTISKHPSTSLLLPTRIMSGQEALNIAGAPVSDPESPTEIQEPSAEKPRTPKRRRTPIYDDYQTAVSMIRSGTPGLPSVATPGLETTASIPVGDRIDVPKTPNRRLSYSLTDRALADSYRRLQKDFPSRNPNILPPAYMSVHRRRISVPLPIFPLKARDSDDENERLITCGEYPAGDGADNPAGIKLDDHDFPLRDIELAQVRSRTRGSPVLSQEVHASSADFDYAEETKNGDFGTGISSSNRGSENAPTEASTVGQIVDQYGSVFIDNARNQSGETVQARDRAHAGPSPSWPLPTPPALPPRSAKRHESSGIVSTPGGYGNTSELLDTKLTDASSAHATRPGIFIPTSPPMAHLKHSKSVDYLVYDGKNNVRDVGSEDDDREYRTRLSHVSEESSGRASSDSGWMAAVGYLGRPPRKEDEHLVEYDTDGRVAAGSYADPDSSARQVTGWSPGHRRTENVFYPSGLSTGRVRRFGVMDLSPAKRFRSLDKILAGPTDTDSDSMDVADDGDWETIHESQSNNNLKVQDLSDEAMTEFAKLPSFGSLSLKKAPVSAWDPLANKTPGFDQSDKLQELLKSHKNKENNKKSQELGKVGMPSTDEALQTVQAFNAVSLPGPAYVASNSPEGSVLSVPKLSQMDKTKTSSQLRYRHPTPLDPLHNNPFASGQPPLHPLGKRPSNLSTDKMPDEIYNLRNRNIESTSSIAGNSVGTASVESREQRNRRILQEIDLYNPDRPRIRKEFPNARLTLDKRVREGRFDPQVVRTSRRVSLWLRILGACTYPVGGFQFLNAMANNDVQGNDAMLQSSRMWARRVVGMLHEDDVELARKWEGMAIAVWLGLIAALVIVLALMLYKA